MLRKYLKKKICHLNGYSIITSNTKCIILLQRFLNMLLTRSYITVAVYVYMSYNVHYVCLSVERGHPVVGRVLRGHPTFDQEISDDSQKGALLKHEQSTILKQTVSESQAKEEMTTPNTTSESLDEQTLQSSSIEYTESNTSVNQTQRETKSPIYELSKLEYTIHDNILDEVRDGLYKIRIAPSDLIDFGGQNSYDMTHQLFIHHSGSFVLMFDGKVGLFTPLKEYPNGKTTASCKYIFMLKKYVFSIPVRFE